LILQSTFVILKKGGRGNINLMVGSYLQIEKLRHAGFLFSTPEDTDHANQRRRLYGY